MSSPRSLFVQGIYAMLVVAFVVGCSAAQKKQERTALDWAQTLCLARNPDAAPEWLAAACGIEETAYPFVLQFLSARRLAAASGSATCPEAAPTRPVAASSASAGAQGPAATPSAVAPRVGASGGRP